MNAPVGLHAECAPSTSCHSADAYTTLHNAYSPWFSFRYPLSEVGTKLDYLTERNTFDYPPTALRALDPNARYFVHYLSVNVNASAALIARIQQPHRFGWSLNLA